MSGDQTTTRLSRAELINAISDLHGDNKRIVKITDDVAALYNERDAYMTALEKALDLADDAIKFIEKEGKTFKAPALRWAADSLVRHMRQRYDEAKAVLP